MRLSRSLKAPRHADASARAADRPECLAAPERRRTASGRQGPAPAEDRRPDPAAFYWHPCGGSARVGGWAWSKSRTNLQMGRICGLFEPCVAVTGGLFWRMVGGAHGPWSTSGYRIV